MSRCKRRIQIVTFIRIKEQPVDGVAHENLLHGSRTSSMRERVMALYAHLLQNGLALNSLSCQRGAQWEMPCALEPSLRTSPYLECRSKKQQVRGICGVFTFSNEQEHRSEINTSQSHCLRSSPKQHFTFRRSVCSTRIGLRRSAPSYE